ncbi:aminotransferase class III-fold pyridoxal phosphate-dependent enzyme [Pseudomaricurvus alkylphenolicus]|uniref:aspartate aminotransferase family protein n=1 Tax=Pseudomaricurvus alkylphenolicus TaxID=1306991 RepID=UPI001421C76C|nr:aminotransferase class III-fold pyridoxal phosphate-dependent enzyme [Pseudomaricurvus alkylphenolicus]NIB42587.1 aminotransferase class III-fold pyridoxal phosphate-dependent enzyme [Pseudomaricurvus alkylphenolicus]
MSTSQTLLERRRRVLGQHSPLFYDNPLHLVRGEGVWLYDADGRRYLDVYNNVPHVGHCHPHVVEALSRQASTLNVHTRYLHENVVRYGERLTATFDDSLQMAMFTCSGSEANELALRMARYCSGGSGILVTDFAYHGNTEAVAELGTAFMAEAKASARVRSIPIPDSYRGMDGLEGEALAQAYADKVAEAIAAFEADGIKLAGMLVCPDFANEGLLKVPPGFLEKAVALVRDAGGLFIADEVQAGFGRSGHHMWAHQAYDVVPDIVTLGKPMGNGHPLAGVVARGELVDCFAASSMYFNTFGGNPVSTAVGMAVLDVLEQEELLDNAVSTGAYVTEGLKKLQQRYSLIGDVRSLGMFFAVELVKDRDNKTPAPEATHLLVNRMREEGVLISKIGRDDSILKLRPPMPFQPEHADLLLQKLDETLAWVETEVVR